MWSFCATRSWCCAASGPRSDCARRLRGWRPATSAQPGAAAWRRHIDRQVDDVSSPASTSPGRMSMTDGSPDSSSARTCPSQGASLPQSATLLNGKDDPDRTWPDAITASAVIAWQAAVIYSSRVVSFGRRFAEGRPPTTQGWTGQSPYTQADENLPAVIDDSPHGCGSRFVQSGSVVLVVYPRHVPPVVVVLLVRAAVGVAERTRCPRGADDDDVRRVELFGHDGTPPLSWNLYESTSSRDPAHAEREV